jgi:hypothetical protein
VWTLFSGLALTFFPDASAATIGGGFDEGQEQAAQRLLGVHLLVLAPLYGLLAWRPERYGTFLWVPYAAQGGVVAVTLWSIVSGDRDLSDGVLPLVVAIIFLVLLLYVTFARRPEAAPPEEAEEAAAGEAADEPDAGEVDAPETGEDAPEASGQE